MDNMGLSANRKKIVHAVFIATLWNLWNARNNKVFKGVNTNRHVIVKEVKEMSSERIIHMSKFK
ncbi:hypothetical protein Hanom_Chr17g01574871 [Helianthus anomalus]